MDKDPTTLGTTITLESSFEDALAATTAALKAEGFGVLTEIDVKATLKEKIGVDFYPYRILGACNPQLAHRALTAAPEVGLLLPCNVTVAQAAENEVEVQIIDPLAMLSLIDHPGLAEVAAEAADKLARVAAALQD